MSLPSRDKPLPCLAPKPVVAPRARQGSRHSTVARLGFFVMAATVLLTGCERREIVRPTPQMDIETRFWVRVLLLADATECTLTSSSDIYMSRSTLSPTAELNRPMATALADSGKVTLANGQFRFGAEVYSGRSLMIGTAAPYVFTLNGQKYRGRLRLAINPDDRTFSVINFVPLEPYLAGVVGAEMPSYWELEALRAQAIAARTYCLYTKERFGVRRDWDVSRTQASQVYRGVAAESAQIWKAVMSTYGTIMVAPGAGAAETDLFPAYYSAVCGGFTEDSQNVFGEAFGPLKTVPCPHCKEVTRLGLFFWPMVQYDRETLTARLLGRYPSLKALGEIQDIVVLEKTEHEGFARLTKIRLVGSTGKTDVLRGEDLRLALDPSGRKLQSTICQIVAWGNGWAFLSGRGWGHGVGMCQYGAEGMARHGQKAEDILDHYYPGSVLEKIY